LKSGLPSRQMHRSPFGKLIFGFALVLAACNPAASSPIGAGTPNQVPRVHPTSTATYVAEIEDSAELIDQMLIVSPGADSAVLSPISFEVLFAPPQQKPIRVELVGENGDILARKVVIIKTDSNAQLAELKTPIYFEIDNAETEAQLIVSYEDDYGRLKALDSVPVTLLSAGEQTLLPSESATHITIAPLEIGTIHTGGILISGVSHTPAGRALNIQLISRAGRVLAFGEVYPTFDVSDLGSFSITLEYEIEDPEWALIAVSERQNGVIIHYASLEVLLNP
jgi:hypothetical protein